MQVVVNGEVIVNLELLVAPFVCKTNHFIGSPVAVQHLAMIERLNGLAISVVIFL